MGGVLARSRALIADALHNFSDAIALAIAFAARKIARRRSDREMTFGYMRVEVVAALINCTTAFLLGPYLNYEAMMRFIERHMVDGWLIVIIAGVALIVNLATAMLTFSMPRNSVNIRAAFLHNLADALGSVAVIFADTLILLFDWRLVDPIVTLVIAGYILWQTYAEIGGLTRFLMLGSPPDIETHAVIEIVRAVDSVADVHHPHFWQMDGYINALDAHVAIAEGAGSRADAIKTNVKSKLKDVFGIEHSNLELEYAVHACDDQSIYGHKLSAELFEPMCNLKSLQTYRRATT